MRNKKISLKYKAMQHLVEDLDCLVSLGFAEFVPDPKTGEYGYRFKEDGVKLLENMKQETNQES
jgi:hypothetical protein